MSVTVLIQNKKGLTRWHPSKAWFAVPVAVAVVSGALIFTIFDGHLKLEAKKELIEAARQEHQSQLDNVKASSEEQIATLATHLAKLQAEMTRLEALGEHIASTYNLQDQFNFESLAGIGGHNHQGQAVTLEQLMVQINQMSQTIEHQQQHLPLLETLSNHLHIDEVREISGRPITQGWLSSNYGIRNDPFSGRRTMHRGIDFAGKEGAEIIATASGIVTWSGYMTGYGNLVEIDHGHGLTTRYGHNKTNLVQVGTIVTKGQAIATMGSTGRSTGPHVHYEVLRNGKQIDPTQYVYRK